MESSFLSAVVLPLALAIIMIGIGLELKISDFTLLFKKPRGVIIGLLGQMVLLPIIGYMVGFYLFDFSSPLIGVGFVILALAPGGSTSNLMSLLSKGDLALSVSLTAFVSVITPLWMPFAIALLFSNIPETKGIELSYVKTFTELFVVSFIPIVIGMLINAKKHEWSLKLRKPVKILSTIFLFLVIIALVIKNKVVITANLDTVGIASIVMVTLTFLAGFLLARVFSLSGKQIKSITFEVGIQNGTLALLVTATILGIPEMTLAAIFYSLIMFVYGFAVIGFFNMKKVENGKKVELCCA
ncbi:MAG: bile acid:sodium symporter family protein [Bacteroidota bacterium]